MSINDINMDLTVKVDPEIVLDEIDIYDVVAYLGADKLLDEIGVNEAIEHFGIEVAE
jgi:hypothetical protein